MNSENSVGQGPSIVQPGHPNTGNTEIAAPAAIRSALWANIPAELRERPQWVVADPDKVPRTVAGTKASVTDPRTWMPFDWAAWSAYTNGGHPGYVLTADDSLTCIDFDVEDEASQIRKGKPVNSTTWTTQEEMDEFWALARYLDSYAEASMSGKGVHLWVRGKIGDGIRRKHVEFYSQARYIACTGNVVLDRPIEDRQGWLTWMADQLRGHRTTCGDLIELPPVESDEAVYWRARSYEPKAWPGKFDALWRGEWKQMGYPSQSEADMALIQMLAAASPSNEQVRRIFRYSVLGQRAKAQRNDYLNRTLVRPRAQSAEAARWSL